MNEYSVLMLGTRNAGKTTFLASLYRSLRVQGAVGYGLKAIDETQAIELGERYTEIADTSKGWPAATDASEDAPWVFNVTVATKRGVVGACAFSFFDYAGGRLTDRALVTSEFVSRMEGASALFILVDGVKILQMLDKHSDALAYVINELGRECEHASRVGAMNHPVHFLLTKWDVVDARGVTLETVRTALLEVAEVRNLVEQRKQEGLPVRLIPVSSVGAGFARLRDDGTMEKVVGALPHPSLVETALACVIIDAVQAEVRRAEARIAAEQNRKVEVDLQLPWWRVILARIPAAIKSIIDHLPSKYRTVAGVLSGLLELGNRAGAEYEARLRTLEEERKRRLEALRDERTALEYVLTCMVKQQTALDEQFPASKLA